MYVYIYTYLCTYVGNTVPSIATTLIPLLPYLKPSVLYPIYSGSDARFRAGSFDFHRAHARRKFIHAFDMTRKVYDMDSIVCRQTDLWNLAPAKGEIRWWMY